VQPLCSDRAGPLHFQSIKRRPHRNNEAGTNEGSVKGGMDRVRRDGGGSGEGGRGREKGAREGVERGPSRIEQSSSPRVASGPAGPRGFSNLRASPHPVGSGPRKMGRGEERRGGRQPRRENRGVPAWCAGMYCTVESEDGPRCVSFLSFSFSGVPAWWVGGSLRWAARERP